LIIIIPGAADAMKLMNDRKREVRKRKAEFLKEQKEKKLAKLKKLESLKLPDSILNNLSSEPVEDEPLKPAASENQIKTFDSDCDSSAEENDLDTGSTRFDIVTKKDLNSDKYRSSEAWSFREKMLFGSRVRREAHSQKNVQKLKQAAGKSTKISINT